MTLPLHTAAETYALEAELARRHSLPPEVLMRRAGAVLHQCLRANWPEARHVLVLAGAGNNGGDGYDLAQRLRREGREVTVLALAEPGAEPAATVAREWRAGGGTVEHWSEGGMLATADLMVDALFGVGLGRPLSGAAAELVDAVNHAPAPVLSVDVPSGLDADSGSVASVAVRATRTLCLLARKRGLFTGRAGDHVGWLDFHDLDVPTPTQASARTGAALMLAGDLPRWLPRRRRSAHKGDHGHVLVIGGDTGMAGAARIAGGAALRAGAGWCSVATRETHAAILAPDRPELMVHGVEDERALMPLASRAGVIAIGPGLGQGDWARMTLTAALAAERPLVLDADALNLLAKRPARLGRRSIITPHPGEAARLLGVASGEIESDRFGAVRELARRFQCVAVLKGAGTLIDDGEQCRVCGHGNPGMASAGMGDALTGIIAAFLGQGLSPFDAAAAGVLTHALAGDAAAGDRERGLLASDLVAALRDVVNPPQ